MVRQEINMIDKSIKNELKISLLNNKLCMYIGSGFSIPCGLPDWKELMRPLAESIGLNIDKETEYMQIAQYYVNEKNRHELNEIIRDKFNLKRKITEISENHKLLTSLSLPEVWTTNYDNALENSYNELKVDFDLKVKKEDLSYGINKKLQIYKVHGSYNNPDECIVTQEDYEDLYDKKKYFTFIRNY